MSSKMTTRQLTSLALMLAVSVVFNFIPGFSTIAAVSFIKYEFSDIPVLITAFAFGVAPGAAVAVVSVWLSFFLGGESGGPWGALMHMIAITVFVLVASPVYSRKKTQVWSLIAMILGVIAMTAVMIPANLIITPIYTGAPRSVVAGLLLPGIIPVNAIKGAITVLVTNLLYPYVSPILHRKHFK